MVVELPLCDRREPCTIPLSDRTGMVNTFNRGFLGFGDYIFNVNEHFPSLTFLVKHVFYFLNENFEYFSLAEFS